MGRVMKTRRIAKVGVNIDFGEPGVGGARRFSLIVVHQPPKCETKSEENLKFCQPLGFAWGMTVRSVFVTVAWGTGQIRCSATDPDTSYSVDCQQRG